MPRFRAPVVLAAFVSLLAAGLTAHADAPETNGVICQFQFASVVDPTAEAGTQTGWASGGPVLLTEQSIGLLPGTTPEAGTLTCKVTIDTAATSDHTLDGQKFSTHSDTGVFATGPVTINYVSPPGTHAFVCSEFTDDSDGVTYYWDEDSSQWSTSPYVPCGLVERSGAPSPTGVLLGCDDGLDNDGDGAADYPADPGCSRPGDTDEHSLYLVCDDGVDNDGDGLADDPADSGCSSPTDSDERAGTVCDDGVDNDGDGAADYPRDLGCTSAADTNERDATYVCDNGIDDDGDGLVDYPADTGCSSAADPSERTIP